MLVLTRPIGTEIVIDGRIRVMVLRVKGNSVRLAVSAPGSMRVDRLEVHERRDRHVTPPRLAAAG
jgi:carbon storage regulator